MEAYKDLEDLLKEIKMLLRPRRPQETARYFTGTDAIPPAVLPGQHPAGTPG